MPLFAAVWMAFAAVLLSYTRAHAQGAATSAAPSQTAASTPAASTPAAATPAAAPAAADKVAGWIADLRNPNQATRDLAVKNMLSMGPDAIPVILPRLSAQRTRVQLMRVIAEMGPKGTARLIQLTEDPALAPVAAETLSLVARPDAASQIPGLLACATKHAELRDSCGRAMVRVASPAAAAYVNILRTSARVPADPLVRTYALLALSQIGKAAGRALPEALAAAHEPTTSLRVASARAMGAFGRSTPEVRAALKASAQDPEGEVRQAATEALKALPKAPAGPAHGTPAAKKGAKTR